MPQLQPNDDAYSSGATALPDDYLTVSDYGTPNTTHEQPGALHLTPRMMGQHGLLNVYEPAFDADGMDAS